MANTFKRMEKKTTLPTERVEELKARIAPYMNDDPFNIDGKPYMICNLYYDDFDDHVIRGSVQLPKYKEKHTFSLSIFLVFFWFDKCSTSYRCSCRERLKGTGGCLSQEAAHQAAGSHFWSCR